MNNFKLNNEQKIESGFKTPEHYFDDFSAKINQRLVVNEPKVISIFERRKTWLFAAVALLVITLSIPVVTTFKSQSNELDKATLEDYLTNHDVISNDDLAELLDEKDIQQMKMEYTIEDKTIEDMLSENSNLEEYIIN